MTLHNSWSHIGVAAEVLSAVHCSRHYMSCMPMHIQYTVKENSAIQNILYARMQNVRQQLISDENCCPCIRIALR